MTRSEQVESSGPVGLLAELLLVGVHLALAASFVRLYEGPFVGFFGDLAAFVLVAGALTIGTRRLRLPGELVLLLPTIGAVLLSTWLLFPDTTTAGLPTGATWDAAGVALREARAGIEEIVAPSEVLVGFQLVAGLALWACVWFADWAAFRLRTPVEAVVPATVIFVFGAVLGSGEHQIWTSVLFAASCLLFIAAHRAQESRVDRAWIAAAGARGSWSVMRVGAGLALAGVIAGALLGPMVPGSGSDPVLGWREGTDGPRDRVALSPIVDLKRRLVDQRDVHLFTVTADRPAYWRTTALDDFDGQIWKSGGTYGEAHDTLPTSAPPAPNGETMSSTQRFEIRVLGSIFVPTAFEARQIAESSEPLRWDSSSSTLIVDSDIDSVDGIDYEIESVTSVRNGQQLRNAIGDDSPQIEDRFEALPPDLPPEVAALAQEVTAGQANRYDQVIALQNWFRDEFEYSLEIPAGHDDNAISAFLRDRVGYCEQFAGTFAAMARSLGIPSRVAIGFTPGELDPERPDTYLVRGLHAHAWPEVWFPDVGWVAFEPTPGRGIPDAQEYTGVPPEQDDGEGRPAPAPVVTTTTAPPEPGGTATTTTTTSTTVPADAASQDPPDREDRGGGLPGWLPWVGGAALLGAAWIGAAMWLPARRRKRTATAEPATAVLSAWDEAAAAVGWVSGTRSLPHETHEELALRAGPALAPLGIDEPFNRLAGLATTAAWSPTALDADQRDRALEVSAEVRRGADDHQPPLRRLLHRLSWRSVFGLD